eukprot:Skav205278  [mRNA]  locus=scaffold1690:40777:60677:+ [translate_table: standard]
MNFAPVTKNTCTPLTRAIETKQTEIIHLLVDLRAVGFFSSQRGSLAAISHSPLPRKTVPLAMAEGSLHRKLFSFPDDQLHLHRENLQLIEAASGLQVVAIMGDGRAGKSYLGNELLGLDVFATSNGGEAMTHGVDMALGPGGQLLLDCEGVNNALAASCFQVSLIGAALASTLIFVLDAKFSEAGLDLLAGVVAEMQLQHKSLPTRLVLVVNKCPLDYEPDALEKALQSTHANRGSREAIKGAFSERHFVVIPFNQLKPEGYQQAICDLKRLVAPRDGHALDGRQLSEMIQGLAVQLRDSTCDVASLHQQIMDRFLRSQVDRALADFSASMGPSPTEFDPDFDIDIEQALRTFEEGLPNLAPRVAEPFVAQLREKLQALVEERRRVNDALGDSIANWRDVLQRGCKLLASRRIGARIVVERRQNLGPFLNAAGVIAVDPPEPLSVRWMWQAFNPHLNPDSHDFAVVLRQGQVVAKRVAAPELPAELLPPRGNARHKAAVSVSLRSDAWVAVVSGERGETSVACAGQLWDVGSDFPKETDYDAQEAQRRNTWMRLRKLWESRRITSSAHGRVHSLLKPWVWDGKARDESGLAVERSGGVHSFSANVGSTRPTSTPDANGGYIRPNNLAGAVQEAAGGLEVGARVRIVGLQKQQHLNSAMGILVKFHGDRWQVRLEGDLGDKLFRAQNLMLASNGRGLGRAAPNGSSRPEPREAPQGRGGFQLFVAGDGPGRCLHPDRPDASVHEFHRLLGPDDNPQGHGWSIGKHPEAARNAAKAAGVPMKEIARVFALHNGSE